MSTPSPLPPPVPAVSDLLEAAVRLARATLPKCLPQAMLAVLCMQVSSIYMVATRQPLKLGEWPSDPKFSILYGVGFVGYAYLLSGVILRQRALARGGRPDLPAELSAAGQRLPVLLLALALAFVAIGLGALALAVPGIYLGICSFVLWQVVLFEGRGPIGALRRCVQLVHPHWWKFCATLVIGALVAIVCVMAAAVVIGIVVGIVANDESAAARAISSALVVACMAAASLFLTALGTVLYSAASSSA